MDVPEFLNTEVQHPKILVVDDEPAILITVKAILEEDNYEVEAAGGGAAAIAAMRQRHFDLVLTDLKMPQPDGLAVLDEVRRSSPQTVTVMMTGYASMGSAVEAVQRGAYEYLMKPVDVADLKAAVQRSLERKRLSEIETLYRVQKALAEAGSDDEICRVIGEAARNVLNVASAELFFAGDGKGPQECPAGPASPNPARAVYPGGRLRQFAPALAKGNEITNERQALVPGIVHGELVCVLAAENGDAPYEFHVSALRFLRALASQAALVLRNRQLIAELQHNNFRLAEANRKLQELDRLKSQFLSVATHELRTPLTVMLGYNSMLAESLRERLTQEEAETLEESGFACKRLIRLVNSMLDVTRIESGKTQMNMASADVRQTVLGVERLFRHEAEQRGIALHVQVPARLPRLLLDEERIQQVLINLVGNALKFTARGGQVSIALRQVTRNEQPWLELSVRDNGIGIAPEDQRRIFDEFAQVRRRSAHAEIADRDRGFGLGLAIVKRIVAAHEGELRVQSAPGQGSTFTVLLPARKAQAAAHRISA